eukprot:TRINITY_DN8159_c0_g1_i1.p1 TRINITY_DN8159_c0_g1~~TRINITY_DN8159_c0_g1_i1.p1  ORF type:complete len:509 (+),score=131.67 TRINITY_DN8159_c0_g1_i1:41-1567(+)
MPPQSPSTGIRPISEVISCVNCDKLAVGKTGRHLVKKELVKNKVLKSIELIKSEHGSMKIVDGRTDKRDTKMEREIDGAVDLLQGLGYEKPNVYHTIAGKLSTQLTSSLTGLDPSIAISLLTWMLPYAKEPTVRTLFHTVICSVLSVNNFHVSSLPSDITDEVLTAPLHALPVLARRKLWTSSETRLLEDLKTTHEKFSEGSWFPYDAQMEAISNYASRLGGFDDDAHVIDVRSGLLDLFAPYNEVVRGQKTLTVQGTYHKYAEQTWDPAFFFALCYDQHPVLQLVLEVCESVYLIDTPGFAEIPARLRTHTTGLDINKAGPSGNELCQALRVPYIISGLHFAAIHIVHNDSMNSRLAFSMLHKLLCKAYRVTCTEQQHLQVIKQGPHGLQGSEDDVVLVNSAWHQALSLLSLLPSSLKTLEAYLTQLALVYCIGTEYCVDLFVTAVGHLVKRARQNAVDVAEMLAQHILPTGENYQHLADFLYDCCAEMVSTEDLTPHLKRIGTERK